MFEAYRKTSFDDVDWCMMVRESGRTIRYTPEVRIIHHEGSFRRQDRDSEFDSNLQRFMAIWRPWENKGG